ncbi:hypothetical protein DEM27_00025 [Metarhizobium album]|uniref:Uncharacterized protein n=1 Tax=Metarhizobium album TaxID=2182425 RepID=A0A2U2DWP2_9HYPH|nr:hypothetical protein [Rhizobium album]PWE57639.1 hypothetical protein DEM27_00025 [Rhizobium album]
MKIRDAKILLTMLESGKVNEDLTATLTSTIKALVDMSRDNPRGTFKSTVTLQLNLVVEDGGEMVEINPKIPTPKLPELKRRTTVYFTTDDGGLSTEHPQQMDMIGGPREIIHNR